MVCSRQACSDLDILSRCSMEAQSRSEQRVSLPRVRVHASAKVPIHTSRACCQPAYCQSSSARPLVWTNKQPLRTRVTWWKDFAISSRLSCLTGYSCTPFLCKNEHARWRVSHIGYLVICVSQKTKSLISLVGMTGVEQIWWQLI